MNHDDKIETLRLENARLVALLEHHGINWRLQEKIEIEPEPIHFIEAEHSPIGTAEKRTEKIVTETLNAFNLGRKVLVLTERTEHLDIISNALAERVPAYFVLHGRMSKKQRATTISELEALSPDEPRILLATGKLVGEGSIILH